MLWDESEVLAGIRPQERAAIEKLDAFLHARKRVDILDPRQMARVLGLREGEVVSLLEAYADQHVVRCRTMVECPKCERLSPADEVRQARTDGVDFQCVSGDEDLAAIEELVEVPIYRLLSEPPPRVDD